MGGVWEIFSYLNEDVIPIARRQIDINLLYLNYF